MKITPKMQKELEVIRFFIPNGYKGINHYEEGVSAEEAYFEKTINGKDVKINSHAEYNMLMEGVRWRGIHCHELYEPGILEGTVPYYVLLEGMPKSVAEYLGKEMFKGEDKDLIMEIWQQIKDDEESEIIEETKKEIFDNIDYAIVYGINGDVTEEEINKVKELLNDFLENKTKATPSK